MHFNRSAFFLCEKLNKRLINSNNCLTLHFQFYKNGNER
jgi:hypothetical protein